MNDNVRKRMNRALTVFSSAIFIATVALTIGMTWYLSENYLQGDISSDLVYANYLYQEGSLFLKEWYGSTEFRILRSEWIFAPLFALFDDWHMVRFVGTMIMQTLVVLSFGYLIRQIRADRNSFFLGASVLLVPYCFSYGVNVLYGCFYAMFVTIIFFSAALMVSLFSDKCTFRTAKMVLLLLLGFSGSLGGPRFLLNLAAPAFLLILYLNVSEKNGLAAREQSALRRALLISVAYAACALAGYLINSRYLSTRFVYADKPFELSFGLFSRLDRILGSFLYACGYLDRLPLTSVRGLVALACACVCLLYLGWCAKTCLHGQDGNETVDGLKKTFVCLFGFFALLVMAALKALTTDIHNNDTYYLLISMWIVPWAAVLPSQMSRRRVRVAAAAVLLVLYGSGLVNMLSFVFPERYKQYGSETFHHMELPRQMRGSCAFLEEEGMTFGYASFWHANVVTEMTDGKIRVAGVHLLPGKDELLDRYYWLTHEDVITRVSDRAFILLTLEEEEALSQNEDMDAVKRIYGDEYFAIYEIIDPLNVYNGLIR